MPFSFCPFWQIVLLGICLKRHSVAFLRAMEYIDPVYHDTVEAFIEEFELSFVREGSYVFEKHFFLFAIFNI